MPFLFPPELTSGKRVFLSLAFGDLSCLELCSMFPIDIARLRVVCDEIGDVEMEADHDGKIQRLAGIHKAAIPIGEAPADSLDTIARKAGGVLNYFTDKQNFCVSLYCDPDKQEYDVLVSSLLRLVRDGGFGKANLVRPHSGYEMRAQEVLNRSLIDFVVFPSAIGYEVGATFYIPDPEGFRARATQRPVVSSEVALSPRLASLLVHLGNVPAGGVLLDPFCGSGTILGEALLEGINCIGVDRNRNAIRNTERNLAWVVSKWNSKHLGSSETLVGDATDLVSVLKGRHTDAIVTEPILVPSLTSTPSLKAARSMIRNASATYSDFLYSASKVLDEGSRLVLVVPSIKTSEGRDVVLTLEGVESVGFREFQPPESIRVKYPVSVGASARWIRRMVYVLERV